MWANRAKSALAMFAIGDRVVQIGTPPRVRTFVDGRARILTEHLSNITSRQPSSLKGTPNPTRGSSPIGKT